VADFIGKANLLPARVVGVTADHLDLEVLGRPLSVPSANGVYRIGEAAKLLVRPEAMLLVERGSEGYPGHVRRTAYLGPLVEYDVDVADTTLCLTQYDPRQVYPVGTEVWVQFVTEALYVLPLG
jgi:ABC-type Fe3+/spermidine/putrescine transport system ATPase subunit